MTSRTVLDATDDGSFSHRPMLALALHAVAAFAAVAAAIRLLRRRRDARGARRGRRRAGAAQPGRRGDDPQCAALRARRRRARVRRGRRGARARCPPPADSQRRARDGPGVRTQGRRPCAARRAARGRSRDDRGCAGAHRAVRAARRARRDHRALRRSAACPTVSTASTARRTRSTSRRSATRCSCASTTRRRAISTASGSTSCTSCSTSSRGLRAVTGRRCSAPRRAVRPCRGCSRRRSTKGPPISSPTHREPRATASTLRCGVGASRAHAGGDVLTADFALFDALVAALARRRDHLGERVPGGVLGRVREPALLRGLRGRQGARAARRAAARRGDAARGCRGGLRRLRAPLQSREGTVARRFAPATVRTLERAARKAPPRRSAPNDALTAARGLSRAAPSAACGLPRPTR